MTDSELTKYLPVHGDRLRLRKYLQKENTQNKRKHKLLAVLQAKLEKTKNLKKKKEKDNSSSDEENEMRRPFGNKNAVKDKRQIELGWIHKTYHRTKQVRSKTGGGTRKIMLSKDSRKIQIMEEAKKLFFPDGESPKGPISEFECDIWDFSEREVKNDLTVAEMYDLTKMPLLRFYLATWEKNGTPNQDNGKANDVAEVASKVDVIVHKTANEGQENAKVDDAVTNKEKDAANQRNDNGIPIIQQNQSKNESSEMDTSDIMKTAMEISGIIEVDNDDLPNLGSELDFDHLDTESTQKEVKITVHRGHLLRELIDQFKYVDPKKDVITFEMVMPNGTVETTADEGGVTRDALTDFWTAFYEQCTVGAKLKLPYLRHDFGEEEWKSIAKIILFGWISQGYFPIQLSMPFLEQSIFAYHTSDLLESFYDIIPEHEEMVLKQAITDFSSVDQDDLFEILESHEIKQIPKASNISRIVQEIAHKEIIQAPMFVADSWFPVLDRLEISKEKLKSMKSDLVPTAKGICKSLKFPEQMPSEEASVANHLKEIYQGTIW